MEASLPISTTPDTEANRRKSSVIATTSISLPLRFVLTGFMALLFGAGWLVAEPSLLTSYHYNQEIIALTHLFVLGWLCTTAMGAIYQLVPVALETKLYSERLARWQFILHLIGFSGMVWMFNKWDMKQVGHFGTVMALSIGLFAFNIIRTLLRVPKWNVVGLAVVSSLFWLSITVTAGLSIAAAKCTYESTNGLAVEPGIKSALTGLRRVAEFMSHFDSVSTMHAHAHLGMVGFFTILIVGISYKLLPMFLLGEIQNRHRAMGSVILLNTGLVGSFVSILLGSPWKTVFALIVITALCLYGSEVVAILRSRTRRSLDGGGKSFLTAVAMLIPLTVLAAILSWPGLPSNGFTGQLENLYGFLGIVGFVTFALLGMLTKIIPFLVWFHTYSPHVGRAQVPTLAGMYSEKVQILGFWTWQTGILTVSAGILVQNEIIVRTGAALLAISLTTFAFNICKTLGHATCPVLRPFATQPSNLS